MIKFLHGRRKRRAEIADPGFSSALNRVRDIREHAEWEPLTDQTTIQERSERVDHVRRQIIIPPLASEHGPLQHEAHIPRRELWRNTYRTLLYGSALMVTGLGIVALLTEREPRQTEIPYPKLEQVTVAFLLSPSPRYTSLTAGMAHEFAGRALKAAGLNTDYWQPMQLQYAGAESYLERIGYDDVIIRFDHSYYSVGPLKVTIQLDRNDKYILCILEPKWPDP